MDAVCLPAAREEFSFGGRIFKILAEFTVCQSVRQSPSDRLEHQ